MKLKGVPLKSFEVEEFEMVLRRNSSSIGFYRDKRRTLIKQVTPHRRIKLPHRQVVET